MQENFLLKVNGYIIKQALPDHHILFKPAEKDYLEGRPKNGMFIAILGCEVKRYRHHPAIGEFKQLLLRKSIVKS